MQIYSQDSGVTLLQQSLIQHDPIGFVLMEDMLLRLTVQRSPAWSPKLILSPGGWAEYKRGQETLRRVKAETDQMWIQLVQSILRARNDVLIWQAGAKLRELQWAESLRQLQQSQDLQLDYHRKQLEIEDAIGKLKETRAHTHAQELLKLQHALEMELEDQRQGRDDPYIKMQRFLDALEGAKPRLETYAAKDETDQVNTWIAEALLDGIRVLGK